MSCWHMPIGWQVISLNFSRKGWQRYRWMCGLISSVVQEKRRRNFETSSLVWPIFWFFKSTNFHIKIWTVQFTFHVSIHHRHSILHPCIDVRLHLKRHTVLKTDSQQNRTCRLLQSQLRSIWGSVQTSPFLQKQEWPLLSKQEARLGIYFFFPL